MKVGYARVSTHDQSVEAQVQALEGVGCEKIFRETASGVKANRPVLKEALEFARPGDTVVVLKLDRFARSLSNLIDLTQSLKDRGVDFQSLTEEINTTTPGGKLLFHLLASISEFERDLIRERTMHGLKAARERGRVGGRPRAMTPDKLVAAQELLAAGTPAKDTAQALGVSVPTLYRWLPRSQP